MTAYQNIAICKILKLKIEIMIEKDNYFKFYHKNNKNHSLIREFIQLTCIK